MRIVDAQVHIWAADTPGRPWPRAGEGGRTAVPQRPVAYGADDLIADMDASGIDRAVLVAPSWEGERSDLVSAAHARFPERLVFMARVDHRPADAARTLRDLMALPGIRGFRFLLGTDIPLADLPALGWLWDAIAAAGLSIMIAPRGHFAALAGIAERHPGLRITIDHLGAHAHRTGADAFVDVDAMLPLARLPNVAVKASGLPDYSALGPPYPDVEPYVRQVYDAFGADRMFFGSDLTRLPRGYPDLLALFDSFTWLTGADREKVMGEALLDWLGWN